MSIIPISMERTADIKRCPMETISIIWSPATYTLPMARIVMTMESYNSPRAYLGGETRGVGFDGAPVSPINRSRNPLTAADRI
jgi:hypothetical protein